MGYFGDECFGVVAVGGGQVVEDEVGVEGRTILLVFIISDLLFYNFKHRLSHP